jgi:KDO2-lipid IV(A) lauroyltransferase
LFRPDSDLWRRAASFGARNGPSWFVRWSPPVIGVLWCAALPDARRAVEKNLVRVRGERSKLRNTIDAARMFATFAGCLAETLAAGSANERPIHSVLEGEDNFHDALADGHGMILATSHSAGWEATGSSLTEGLGIEVIVAMQRERDARSHAHLQDRAREARGVRIVQWAPIHSRRSVAVALEDGRAVALQIDRAIPGMRMRERGALRHLAQMPEDPCVSPNSRARPSCPCSPLGSVTAVTTCTWTSPSGSRDVPRRGAARTAHKKPGECLRVVRTRAPHPMVELRALTPQGSEP